MKKLRIIAHLKKPNKAPKSLFNQPNKIKCKNLSNIFGSNSFFEIHINYILQRLNIHINYIKNGTMCVFIFQRRGQT